VPLASTAGELDAIMDAKRVEVKLRLTKQKNYGRRACKPDSVPHGPCVPMVFTGTRIPCCGDHSSRSRFAPVTPAAYPRVFIYDGLRHRRRSAFIFMNADSSSRAGSPLLFGLAPRGVFRAPGVATGAVGSYPTFHPCQTMRAFRRRPAGFPARCHRAALRRRSISVALSVALRVAQALAYAPHCAPWRYQARCPVKSTAPHKVKSVPQDGVRTFLPPSHLSMTGPAIHPARPPVPIIL